MARTVELTVSGSPRNVRASTRCRNPLRTAGESVTRWTLARAPGVTPQFPPTLPSPRGHPWAPALKPLGHAPDAAGPPGNRPPDAAAEPGSPASPLLIRRRAEHWAANSLSWACRGPASTEGPSSHCRACTSTLRKSDEKPVSWGAQRWGRARHGSDRARAPEPNCCTAPTLHGEGPPSSPSDPEDTGRGKPMCGRGRGGRGKRGPPGTGRAGASRGRQGRGCGAWPGPGPRRAGSSAGRRGPAGGARRRPAPRGSPGGLVPAPGPGPAAAPGRRGVRGNSSTVGLGSMGRSVQRKGAVRPAADTLIQHCLQAGVQRGPWTGDRGAKGNRSRRPRVDLCTHMCASVSARKRHVCSAAAITVPISPGHGRGRGRGPPAGAGRPGRPLGPAPAPASQPRSRPGPVAALGCFWVSAPLRCLQGGKGSVSEKPSHPLHWDPATQGQARVGPAAHRGAAHGPSRELSPGTPASPGLPRPMRYRTH